LMISRRIVRAFGGELSAADAPQGGSRFVIDLPAVPDPETALADAEAPPPFPPQTQTTRVP
jgi:K+-sensing histidine kinase KdpD